MWKFIFSLSPFPSFLPPSPLLVSTLSLSLSLSLTAARYPRDSPDRVLSSECGDEQVHTGHAAEVWPPYQVGRQASGIICRLSLPFSPSSSLLLSLPLPSPPPSLPPSWQVSPGVCSSGHSRWYLSLQGPDSPWQPTRVLCLQLRCLL